MSNTKIRFRVSIRDVDGTGYSNYRSLSRAAARFEALAGHSVKESFDFIQGETPYPAPDQLLSVRGVSNYGTQVVIKALDEEGRSELARLAAPRPKRPVDMSDAELVAAEEDLAESIDCDQRLGDGEPTPKAILDEYNALCDECRARNIPGFKPAPFEFPTTGCNPTNAQFANCDLPF